MPPRGRVPRKALPQRGSTKVSNPALAMESDSTTPSSDAMKMETTQTPRTTGRTLGLGALLLLSALTACDAGGRAKTIGGVGPPGGPTLQVDFGLRRDIGLGSTFPGDVRHIDLNSDGIQDLIQTNFLPMQISIAFGNPNGTFATIAQRGTLGHAWRLETGDFDGDGDIDIAVASHEYLGTGSQGVQIFMQGPGVGEFTAAPITAALSVDPIDLAAAPISGVKGDLGIQELFVALRDEKRVAILGVSGTSLVETGSLSSSALAVTGGPCSIAVIDLGGNGELDLVVGETRLVGLSDRIVQYARDMTVPGNFLPAGMVMTPVFKPVVDNVGRVDSDIYDDIACAQQSSSEVILFRGDAAGLSQAITIDFGGETTSLIFPDLDQDGLAEAVATLVGQSSVQVRPGTGALAWGPPVHYNVGPIPRAISVISLAGNPAPSLLCGNSMDISILPGLGAGLFRGARGYATGVDMPRGVLMADLDNDGAQDAVVVSQDQRQIAFMKGGADGTFESEIVLPLMPTLDETPGNLAIADIDVDGRLDVLTSVSALDEIRFYRNNGTIDGFADPLPMHVTTVGSEPAGIAVADLNGDAMPDVLVANVGDDTLQVLLNAGGGQFTPQAALPLSFTPLGSSVMDFDGDGNMDAAVFGRTVTGFVLAILGGDGTGVLAVDNLQVIPSASNGLAIGDFDEDGAPDIVVGQILETSTKVIVLMNQGGLSFNASAVTIGPGPGTVMVSDIDNDTHLDIVVVTVKGELRIALGDGTGVFPSVIPTGEGDLALPFYTLGAALEDLNNDQMRDIVTVSPFSPFLWVGTNTSTPKQQP